MKTGPAAILQMYFYNKSKGLNAARHAQHYVDGDLGTLHAQRMTGKCGLTQFNEHFALSLEDSVAIVFSSYMKDKVPCLCESFASIQIIMLH